MLTYGRPLHVYDLAKLDGALVARRARDGEEVLALNGKTYRLDATMTVIADDRGVHDIGGIMGGEHSGVTEATTDILIECAYFDPERDRPDRAEARPHLRRAQRASSAASIRPSSTPALRARDRRWRSSWPAARRRELVRAGAPPRLDRGHRLSARALPRSWPASTCPKTRQAEILAAARLRGRTGDSWRIKVPSWRRDVDGPADIVEEVVRIHGLDKVPSTPLPRAPGVARPTATPEQKLERKVRRTAAARGLNEAVTWSFIAEARGRSRSAARPGCSPIRSARR